jgi:hypothetical protein
VGLDPGRQPFMSCRGGGRGRSRPPAASQISEATYCRRVRPRPPPRRGQSRLPRHGYWCATWWGRERGATTVLVLVVVVVPATLVNDHLLLLEHGSLRVDDGGRDGTMATTTAWTTRTASHCASRRPCHANALSHASRLSCSERREKERREDEMQLEVTGERG